jgi:glycerate 2-kinase
LERAQAAGLDIQKHLAEFNAAPLLEKLGDSIHTGPTGTNVRDVRVLLAY